MFGFKKNKSKQDLETALNELPVNVKVLQIKDKFGTTYFLACRKIGRFVYINLNGTIPTKDSAEDSDLNYMTITETVEGFLPKEFCPTYEKNISDYSCGQKIILPKTSEDEAYIGFKAGLKCVISPSGKVTLTVLNYDTQAKWFSVDSLYMII